MGATVQTGTWMRPLLRWAGSKRSLLPILRLTVPENFDRYIEPFAGSACLFFAIKPSSAILSDFNDELMRTYSLIAKHPRVLARRVASLQITRDNYYRIRSIDPCTLDPLERAARFVFLNRNCFNGVYRTDRLNRFNVPMGSRVGSTPTEQEFYRASIALRAAKLSSQDFELALKEAKSGDFVYLDPPYSTSARNSSGEYGYGAFSAGDLGRLISGIKSADKRGVNMTLSYAQNDELLNELCDWSFVQLPVVRQIGGRGEHRKHVTEILASNSLDLVSKLGTHLRNRKREDD